MVLIQFLVSLAATFMTSAGLDTTVEPEFAEPIRNITVPLGREAVLSCVINNLAEYKVGWLRADDQTILSLHRRIVTHNPRILVTHESGNWSLRIRQVKETDRGCYMCQINTAVMKKQMGCIEVQVPPDILDENSTSDVTVNEGDNVTLTCKAKGKPTPRITWKREDGERILLLRAGIHHPHSMPNLQHSKTAYGHAYNPHTKLTTPNEVVGSEKWSTKSGQMDRSWPADGPSIHEDKFPHSRDRAREVETYHGEVLRLYRVGRRMMGAYMCIANNDLPPAVSKRVSLNVNFAPTVKSETQLLGAPIGSEIKLICHVEAYPQSINFWTKGHHTDNTMLLSSKKYRIDEERTGYNCIMSLTIRDFNLEDENTYKCGATNSLGDAEASIRLYKIKTETQKSPVLVESLYTTGTTQSSHVLVRKNDKDANARIHTEEISPSSSGMKDQRQSSSYVKQQPNQFAMGNAILPIPNGFLVFSCSLVFSIWKFFS